NVRSKDSIQKIHVTDILQAVSTLHSFPGNNFVMTCRKENINLKRFGCTARLMKRFKKKKDISKSLLMSFN
ncbi:hypothetical protein MH051_07830, partial [Bacillus safensis]|uniref:hypothetical protein n=1 Tax=Bacillus safensis TaxID=561879 RepID=UPI002281B351